jgi:hypothetical protein
LIWEVKTTTEPHVTEHETGRTAVDNLLSEYRALWVPDTMKMDGAKYPKQNNGAQGKILLLVYPVTSNTSL